MYRDFIYLDTDRIQSILAQLQEGLLNQVIEQNTEGKSTDIGASGNLLSLLIPASISASRSKSSNASLGENKVLHDYAFSLALKTIRENGLLLDDVSYSDSPTGFVSVQGHARISDYRTLGTLAENWNDLNNFFFPAPSNNKRKQREQSEDNVAITGSKVVIDTFFGDEIQVRLNDSEGNSFVGPIHREHLREAIESLIFKHGSNPAEEWNMLAEVTRVPSSSENPEQSMEDLMADLSEEEEDNEENSAAGQFDKVIQVLNSFQELLNSPRHPDIAVSPIAIYREVPTSTD